jgi:predicted ArsR family transcriptional regulator
MSDDSPGVAAWKEHTSAFDRVRSVAESTGQPLSAGEIATEAAVAENTARTHLERLVEMNVLLRISEDGTALYTADPLHVRAQTLRELLDEHSHDELISLKREIQTRIESWESEYGVVSPDALREQAGATETAEATKAVRETAQEWDLAEYRLEMVEDAIENYTTYTREGAVSV